MRQGFAAAIFALAGCSSAPRSELMPTRSPATPEEEFERIALELRSWRENKPLFIPPSTFQFEPIDSQKRLTELACTSPILYDRLINLAIEPGLEGSLRFDHDSACSLGEQYSLGLVSELMDGKVARRRQVLLLALRHHARHRHVREVATQLYPSSVPGRLSQAYDAFPQGERWLVMHVLAGYSPFVREALEDCFTRAADESEPNPIRAHLFRALLRDAFANAGAEVRYEMLQRFCDLIFSRCNGAAASFVEYALTELPSRSSLSPREFALCESTLEQVVRSSPRVEPRFRALRVLAGLESDRVLPLVELLLGEDPPEELVTRAFGALDGISWALDAVYTKTPHTLFRAYADSRRVTSLTDDLRDKTTRRLLGWLRDDPDERVRRVALHGLIEEVVGAFRNRRGDYASTLERAREVLDLVLREPARSVRELAANYLSSYSHYLGYLDSETRDKVDKVFKSVGR